MTAVVIGSCSHILDFDWARSDDSTYAIKGYDNECRRAAVFITTCQPCKQDYQRSKMILENEVQVSAWLRSGNEPLHKSKHKHKNGRHKKPK